MTFLLVREGVSREVGQTEDTLYVNSRVHTR